MNLDAWVPGFVVMSSLGSGMAIFALPAERRRLRAPSVETHYVALLIIFAWLIAGVGVKAALLPLHVWLPAAMVARKYGL